MKTTAADKDAISALRMPRVSSVEKLLFKRCQLLVRVANRERKPKTGRRCGTSMGSFVMWSMGYRNSKPPLAKRLIASDPTQGSECAYWLSPQWPWRSQSAGRTSEAERIAERFKVTYVQLHLIDWLLYKTYQIGTDKTLAGIYSVGLVNERVDCFRESLSFGRAEYINRRLVELVQKAAGLTPPLRVLLDEQVTALLSIIQTLETIKCVSLNQSRN